MTTSNIVAPSFGADVPRYFEPSGLVTDGRAAMTTSLASSDGRA